MSHVILSDRGKYIFLNSTCDIGPSHQEPPNPNPIRCGCDEVRPWWLSTGCVCPNYLSEVSVNAALNLWGMGNQGGYRTMGMYNSIIEGM